MAIVDSFILRAASHAVDNGCSDAAVYAEVAIATDLDPEIGAFFADPNNPHAGLSRDEVATALGLAAAYVEQVYGQ